MPEVRGHRHSFPPKPFPLPLALAWLRAECFAPSARLCALEPNATLDGNSTAIGNTTAGQTLEEHSVRGFENTTLFYISCFQYIAVALAFAKGRPFRQPTHTNGE